MAKLNKKALASAAAKKYASYKTRKRKTYATPNYRVDVHITTSNRRPLYNSKKSRRK